VESKKLGENTCFNLHNNTCISSSITLRCSTFSVVELNSLKKRLSSARTFQIDFGNESNAIGGNHLHET